MTLRNPRPFPGSRRGFVIDASVVTKWFLADERHAFHAVDIRAAWERGGVDLIAPTHIRVEVPRALQVAVRDGRLDPMTGREGLDNFLEVKLPTIPTDELVRDAFALCSDYGVALYDTLHPSQTCQAGTQ